VLLPFALGASVCVLLGESVSESGELVTLGFLEP
jgi:hypothetical protein